MLTNILHHIFHHVGFAKVDPLGGGLREEILAEQAESDAFSLEEGLSEEQLNNYLQQMTDDVKQGPDRIRFADDE